MSSDQKWILAAFVFYLAVMLLIGVLYFKRTKNTEDYFLGGRSLGGWVAALSAQASDMSGWLLMGLPGAIYAAGTGPVSYTHLNIAVVGDRETYIVTPSTGEQITYSYQQRSLANFDLSGDVYKRQAP